MEPVGVEAAGVAVRRGVMRSVWRSWSARIGLFILAVFAFIAVFGTAVAPHSIKPTRGEIFLPPSGTHLFGTDDAGVDVFSFILKGARVSLIVGVVSGFGSGLGSGFGSGLGSTVFAGGA